MISDDTRVRVLHIAPGLGMGGTEKTMQLFVANLDRSRFLPLVYAPLGGPREALITASGVRVMVGGDLFRIIGRFRPHIVHIHRAGWPQRSMMRPLFLHRGAGAFPRIVETNVFGRHDPTPDGHLIDLRLFVSRFCLERYLRHFPQGETGCRLDYLYNPVDTDFFATHCPERKDMPMTAGRISRADKGKWSPLGWRFLPLVVREEPKFLYRIIGAIDAAKSFFRDSGLEGQVEYLPEVADEGHLADFFKSVGLLAHANDTGESFGMVIAEAMAAGLPVITHPCPGERDNAQLELVDHEVTGLVATDPRSYARAVLRLLRSPDEARAMGRAGRAKASRLFAAPVVTRRLEAFYQELLNPARPSGRP